MHRELIRSSLPQSKLSLKGFTSQFTLLTSLYHIKAWIRRESEGFSRGRLLSGRSSSVLQMRGGPPEVSEHSHITKKQGMIGKQQEVCCVVLNSPRWGQIGSLQKASNVIVRTCNTPATSHTSDGSRIPEITPHMETQYKIAKQGNARIRFS